MNRIVILNNGIEAEDYGRSYRKPGDVILPIGPGTRRYALEKG